MASRPLRWSGFGTYVMTISLLSRLSDNNPSQPEEGTRTGSDLRETLAAELKMLLMSRPRIPGTETIPLISGSVLNYGFEEKDEAFSDFNARQHVLETRLLETLKRFEPRLSAIHISGGAAEPQTHAFILQGIYCARPVTMNFNWDICSRRFLFDE